MSDRIKTDLHRFYASMQPQMYEKRMAVELTLEQWQFVTSMVLNSAYIRAKPIIEAIESRAKELDEIDRFEAQKNVVSRERVVQLEGEVGIYKRQQAEMVDLRRRNGEMQDELRGIKAELRKLRRESSKPNGEAVSDVPELPPS